MSFHVELKLKVPKDFLDFSGFYEHMSGSMVYIAREGRDYWRTIAGQRLKTSREKYKKAVTIWRTGPTDFAIGIDGEETPHVVAMEVGSDPYELHPNTPHGKTIPLNTEGLIHPDRSANVKFVKKTKKWMHPGFDGFDMRVDVKNHLTKEVLPKYITEALKKAMEGQ